MSDEPVLGICEHEDEPHPMTMDCVNWETLVQPGNLHAPIDTATEEKTGMRKAEEKQEIEYGKYVGPLTSPLASAHQSLKEGTWAFDPENVKRWAIGGFSSDNHELEEYSRGDYVEYKDFAQLLALYREAVK